MHPQRSAIDYPFLATIALETVTIPSLNLSKFPSTYCLTNNPNFEYYMFGDIPFISQNKRGTMGRFCVKEQSPPFHVYGSPMETELITPFHVDFLNGQWRPSSTLAGDIYAAPPGRRPSDGVSTLMGQLSLNRRQSIQALMMMDLDRADTLVHSPFEAEGLSLCMESEADKEPTMRTIDFHPTPPLTPPSLLKAQSQSPGLSYTPGSMFRLRSIAPRPITTSHEEPVVTSGSFYMASYAPRIRRVSLPVVSPMSGIEVDGFREIRESPQSFQQAEPLHTRASNAYDVHGRAWEPGL